MLDEAVATNRLSVVEIVGEAGIGKTTLLDHLGASARTAGALVLSARCSEYERDVPYALLIDALDAHLAAHGPPRGLPQPRSDRARRRRSRRWPAHAGPPVERHELHRAVRALLERARRPARARRCCSTTCTGPTRPRSRSSPRSCAARRPRLLLALAHRHRQADSALDPELRRAADAGPGAPADARAADARRGLAAARRARRRRRAAAACYAESGGNPFHLMQLARTESAGGRPRRAIPATARSPRPCARRCSARPRRSPPTRGRCWTARRSSATRSRSTSPPRSPGLSAPAALEALDVLVAADLVRGTDDVRRFRFRHPIVRRTVYETVGPGPAARRARARRGRAGARRAPDRSRSPITSSSPPRPATPRPSPCSPRPRPQVAGARAADGRALAHGRPHARARAAGGRRCSARSRGALAGAGRFADARRVLLELLAPLPEDAPARMELIAAAR